MARPRKPTHLKLVSGTARKDRLTPGEPKLPTVALPCPEHLSSKAKSAWGRVAPMLHRMGVLTEADALALEQLCGAYATILHCQAVLADYGDLSYASAKPDGGTMRRPHPEVAILADADRRFRLYLNDFGMSPSSRGRVSANGPGDTDPLGHFFS